MRFGSRQLYAGLRVASVIVASLAASAAFAQLNLRPMPVEFGNYTQTHEPTSSFESGPVVTMSTFSFFPQIDKSVNQKAIVPPNPDPRRLKLPGMQNSLAPGGLTGHATAVVSARFPGLDQTGPFPPDPHMAVGPAHVVQGVNSQIGFYRKSDGENLLRQNVQQFFSPITSLTFMSDPRVFYDQFNDRFIILILALANNFSESFVLVAASDDSDPNGNWNMMAIDSIVDIGGDHWFDYPMPGYNAEALVINGNMFPVGAGGFGGAQSFVVPTAGLYDGSGTTVTGFTETNQASVQAAGNMGTTSPFIYGMSVQNGGSIRLYAWGDFTGTPTMVSTIVTVPNFTFSPPAATRGGGVLDSLSSRILDANYREGFLVGAHTVAVIGDASRSRIQWYEFSTNDWPNSGLPGLAQSGEIVLPGTENAIQPAINKNVFGDITVLFTRCSPNISADTMIATRVVTDGDGILGSPTQLSTSVGTWSGRRWGDYFAIVTDPGDDSTFWGNGENLNSNNQWTTSIDTWTVTLGGGGNTGVNYDIVSIAANEFPASSNTYPELLGRHFSGALVDLTASDNGFFDVDSAFLPGQGHYGSLRADFTIAEPASTIDVLSITIESHLSPGNSATGTLFLFNFVTNSYQYIKALPLKSVGNSQRLIKIKNNAGNFVSSGGQVRVVLRGHDPFRRRGRNPEPFRIRTDLIRLNVVAS